MYPFPAHHVEGVVSSIIPSSRVDLIDLRYIFLHSPKFPISLLFFSFVLFGFSHLGSSAQCLTPTVTAIGREARLAPMLTGGRSQADAHRSSCYQLI